MDSPNNPAAESPLPTSAAPTDPVAVARRLVVDHKLQAAIAALSGISSDEANALREEIRPILSAAAEHAKRAAIALGGKAGPIDPALALTHLNACLLLVADDMQAIGLQKMCVQALEHAAQAIAAARHAEALGDKVAAEAAWQQALALNPASKEALRRHADGELVQRARRRRQLQLAGFSFAGLAALIGAALGLQMVFQDHWENDHRQDLMTLRSEMDSVADYPELVQGKADAFFALVGDRRLKSADLVQLCQEVRQVKADADSELSRRTHQLDQIHSDAAALAGVAPAAREKGAVQLLSRLSQAGMHDAALTQMLEQIREEAVRDMREAEQLQQTRSRLDTAWAAVKDAGVVSRVPLDQFRRDLEAAGLSEGARAPYERQIAEFQLAAAKDFHARLTAALRLVDSNPAAANQEIAALEVLVAAGPLSDAALAVERAAIADAKPLVQQAMAKWTTQEKQAAVAGAMRDAIARLSGSLASDPEAAQVQLNGMRSDLITADVTDAQRIELRAALTTADAACRNALSAKVAQSFQVEISFLTTSLATEAAKVKVKLPDLAARVKEDTRVNPSDRSVLDTQMETLRQALTKALARDKAKLEETKSVREAIASYRIPAATAATLLAEFNSKTPRRGTIVRLMNDFMTQSAKVKAHEDIKVAALRSQLDAVELAMNALDNDIKAGQSTDKDEQTLKKVLDTFVNGYKRQSESQ